MASAGLAIAANAFAPVGLADVAFRLGKNLYDTLKRFQNAPVVVIQFTALVLHLENAIASVNSYLNELENSSFITEDGQELPDLNVILQGCADELTKLNISLQSCVVNHGSTRRIQWAKSSRFLSLSQSLEQSQGALKGFIEALNIQLAAVQGQSQINLRRQNSLLRREIDGVQNQLSAGITDKFVESQSLLAVATQKIRLEIQTATDTANNNIHEAANHIRQGFDQSIDMVAREQNETLSSINSNAKRLYLELDKIDMTNQERIKLFRNALTTDIASSARQTQASVHAMHQDMLDLGQAQEAFADDMCLTKAVHEIKLNNIQNGITRLLASVDIAKINLNDLEVEGNDLHMILPLLLHIESSILQNPSFTMRSTAGERFSSVLQWLKDELENLIEAGLQTRKQAKMCVGGISLSSQEYCGRGSSTSIRSRIKRAKPELLYTREVHCRKIFDVWKLETEVGNVEVEFSCNLPCGRVYQEQPSTPNSVRIRFLPGNETALHIGFDAVIRQQKSLVLPMIRQIRIWNTIPSYSTIFDIIRQDNIEVLRESLMLGKVSVYDCDEYGNSLLSYALTNVSARSHKLLLQLGGRMRANNPFYVMRGGLWPDDKLAVSSIGPTNGWHSLWTATAQHGGQLHDLGMLDPGDTPLAFLCRYGLYGKSEVNRREILQLAKALIDSGDDVNVIDSEGSSLLHILVRKFGQCLGHDICFDLVYLLSDLLVRNGANVNTVDHSGQNCMHALLASVSLIGQRVLPYYIWTLADLRIDVYTKLFRCLLQHGCDPNTLDNQARTPLDHLWGAYLHGISFELLDHLFDGTGFDTMEVPTVRSHYDEGLLVVKKGTREVACSTLNVEAWCRMKADHQRVVPNHYDTKLELLSEDSEDGSCD